MESVVVDEAGRGKPIEQARSFFQSFALAIKNISLYRHDPSGFARFLTPAYELLLGFHESFGSLSVRLKPFDFYLSDSSVFYDESQENNIPYKFYREGFRMLTFEVGMTLEALHKLIELMIHSPRELGAEDLNSLFWRENIPFFSYLVLEGFQEEEEGELEGQEVDKLVDYLQHQIRSSGEGGVNFRGLSEEDLALHENLADAETQRGVRLRLEPVAADVQERIQALLKEEESLLPIKAMELVLILLTQSDRPDEVQNLENIILPIAENLLLGQDYQALCFLVEDLLSIGEDIHPGAQHAFELLQQNLIEQLGTSERLVPVLDLLNSSASEELQDDLQLYLLLLGGSIQGILVDRLVDTTSVGRRLILGVLLVQDNREELLREVLGLYGEDRSFLLDLISVGRNIPNSFGLETLQEFVRSPVSRVRMEALLTLATQFPEEAIPAANALLEDDYPATKRAAVEVLCKSGDDGVVLLFAYVNSNGFWKGSPIEREALFRSLGNSRNTSAMSWFAELLLAKSSWFRPRVDALKELAVCGLASSSDPRAPSLVQTTLEEGHHSKKIREALEQALQNLRFRTQGPPAGA